MQFIAMIIDGKFVSINVTSAISPADPRYGDEWMYNFNIGLTFDEKGGLLSVLNGGSIIDNFDEITDSVDQLMRFIDCSGIL